MILANGIFRVRFQSIGFSLMRNCLLWTCTAIRWYEKCLQCGSNGSSDCCLQYDCVQPCHTILLEWFCNKFCRTQRKIKVLRRANTKCNQVICLITRIVLVFRVNERILKESDHIDILFTHRRRCICRHGGTMLVFVWLQLFSLERHTSKVFSTKLKLVGTMVGSFWSHLCLFIWVFFDRKCIFSDEYLFIYTYACALGIVREGMAKLF